MKIFKTAFSSQIYESLWKVLRKIIDGEPKEKAIESIAGGQLTNEAYITQLEFLVDKVLRDKPNLTYEDLPTAYRPQGKTEKTERTQERKVPILPPRSTLATTACKSCGCQIKNVSNDCGGFQKPKGHLDTQMFPECEGTPCDRNIVKKTVEKRNKKSKKGIKKAFNLKQLWLEKKAELSENIVPVEQILGTHPEGNADQIDKEMHSKGYFLFRENYHFGKMLSYQNKKGDKVYLLDGKVWVTWPDVIKELQESWRPTGQEELAWYYQNVANWK